MHKTPNADISISCEEKIIQDLIRLANKWFFCLQSTTPIKVSWIQLQKGCASQYSHNLEFENKSKKGEKKGWACQYSHGPTAFPRKQVRTTQPSSIWLKSQFLLKIISKKREIHFPVKNIFQKERNTVSRERFFPISSPLPTSHFLFLSDPWYLLRCRWMVGNSDGSVIETYSPDAGGSDGDNNKISISAKSGSMPPSGSQWTGRVSKFPTWNIQTGNRFRSLSYLGSRLVNRLPN